MDKEGQSAVELIIIMGVIIVFFMTFLIVLGGNFSDLSKKKESLLIKELAIQVQTEINLASKSSDGYYREFTLQNTLEGRSYEVNITDARVFVRTPQNAISLNVEEVEGDVKKGLNTIRKANGGVFLNQ